MEWLCATDASSSIASIAMSSGVFLSMDGSSIKNGVLFQSGCGWDDTGHVDIMYNSKAVQIFIRNVKH